jgi:hypothetical protein
MLITRTFWAKLFTEMVLAFEKVRSGTNLARVALIQRHFSSDFCAGK